MSAPVRDPASVNLAKRTSFEPSPLRDRIDQRRVKSMGRMPMKFRRLTARFGLGLLVTVVIGAAAPAGAARAGIWTVVPSPSVGTDINELEGVAALSTTDAWAVGFFRARNTYRTLTEHFNGSTWSVVPSPNVGSGGSFL